MTTARRGIGGCARVLAGALTAVALLAVAGGSIPTVRAAALVVKTAPAAASHPRNRLIGPHLNVGVTTYSDCTGRTPLPRATAAVDTCMTWDRYFVGHSYGGPFAGLTDARNGETLTWYDAAGTAHRYTIRGHQYTSAYARAPIPPRGTAAQFQTCLTPSGSRIVTFYAVSA